MTKKYDKLVRDKIPEIVKARGENIQIHIANEAEYWQKLKEKLQEEVSEFLVDESIAEMADVLEVIDALCEIKGFAREDVLRVQKQKADERGGFRKRIILEES